MSDVLLANFKELYDEGLITKEEFEAKKKEVAVMAATAAGGGGGGGGAPADAGGDGAFNVDDILAELDAKPAAADGGGGGGAAANFDAFISGLAKGALGAALGDKAPPATRAAAGGAAAAEADQFINCEHTITGHKGFVFDTAFHKNRLFTASADKTIMVWDLASLECIKTLSAHTNNVSCLHVDVSGGWDLFVRVWNLDSFEEIRTLKGHTGYVSAIRVVGDKLLTGSWDASVIVWDRKTLKKVDTLSVEHHGTIHDMALFEKRLFTACQDKTIKVWSSATFNYKDTMGEIGGGQHTDWVTCMALVNTPDGVRLFSASRDKSIRVWDLGKKSTEAPVKVIEGAHDAAITCMQPMRKYLLTGDGKGNINIWHTETYDLVESIKAHKQWVESIHAVGDYIFTSSRDKTVKCWI